MIDTTVTMRPCAKWPQELERVKSIGKLALSVFPQPTAAFEAAGGK